MQIEGIPNGWEVVEFRYACEGEYFLNDSGKVEKWLLGRKSTCVLPIIRKIEKPKQYRAFRNAAEAEPFWDKKLRMKEWRAEEPGKAMFRINAIGDEDVSIGFQVYNYQSAFDIYECIDGTPFGIEVTE